MMASVEFIETKGFFSETPYGKESCAFCGKIDAGAPAFILSHPKMELKLKVCVSCKWKVQNKDVSIISLNSQEAGFKCNECEAIYLDNFRARNCCDESGKGKITRVFVFQKKN